MTTPCSVLGERLGEDLAASAPTAGRFLRLEQPGPWPGRNAVTTSDLDEGIGRALLARADEAGVKVHLVRRSSRRSALERGEIALEHLRGRAGDSWAVQAADVLVRRELDLRAIDALAVEGAEEGVVTLRIRDGARLRATVAQRDDEPRPISCGAEPETVPGYTLVDLQAA